MAGKKIKRKRIDETILDRDIVVCVYCRFNVPKGKEKNWKHLGYGRWACPSCKDEDTQ